MPDVPRPMTANRAAILRMLSDLGGVRAENLTRGQKSIGTSLQRDGFAAWKAGVGSNRHSLHGQTLHITDAGRAALRSYLDEWCTAPASD